MLTFIGPYQKSLKGSVHIQSATLNFQSPPIQSLNISRGILKLSIICNMVTVSQRCKKPLSVSTVNSQVSLLFSNIIGSKYENGMSYDLFLAATQPRPQGCIIQIEHRVSTEFRAIQFTKNFITQEIRRKTRCEHMETIIHFRKIYDGSTIILLLNRIKGQTRG